jgi:hypothetical protein
MRNTVTSFRSPTEGYSGCYTTLPQVSHRPERQDQGYKGNALSNLLGVSTSMDVDVDSVEGELNAYTRVQQVPLDTDPLISVVEAARARVPSPGPDDQVAPGCSCHFCVS